KVNARLIRVPGNAKKIVDCRLFRGASKFPFLILSCHLVSHVRWFWMIAVIWGLSLNFSGQSAAGPIHLLWRPAGPHVLARPFPPSRNELWLTVLAGVRNRGCQSELQQRFCLEEQC